MSAYQGPSQTAKAASPPGLPRRAAPCCATAKSATRLPLQGARTTVQRGVASSASIAAPAEPAVIRLLFPQSEPHLPRRDHRASDLGLRDLRRSGAALGEDDRNLDAGKPRVDDAVFQLDQEG